MCLKISNIMSLLLSHFKVNDWKIAWLDMKHVNSLQSFQGLEELFSGFGISPKYGVGIGKTISILTGSGIWLFPGKQDSPKIGDGMQDLRLHVCWECPKRSRPTGSSSQSESTSRALSGVSFRTKHPLERLVNCQRVLCFNQTPEMCSLHTEVQKAFSFCRSL